MAWVALSVTDIQNSLTEAEQSGISSPAAEADLTVIVQSVTGLVRGKVNANKRNQGHLGPPGTIPDELYAAAISIARFKYLTHLPGTQLITVDRRADKDEALQQLADVASGDLVIVRGDDVSGQTPEVGVESGWSGTNLQGPYPWLYGVMGTEPDWYW
jgi:hypothetical protein